MDAIDEIYLSLNVNDNFQITSCIPGNVRYTQGARCRYVSLHGKILLRKTWILPRRPKLVQDGIGLRGHERKALAWGSLPRLYRSRFLASHSEH